MRRILGIVFALLVVGLAGGFLSLGAFPPKPALQPVHRVIANDRLGGAQPG